MIPGLLGLLRREPPRATPGLCRTRIIEAPCHGNLYAVRFTSGPEVELLANWITVGRGVLSTHISTRAVLGGDEHTSRDVLDALQTEIVRRLAGV